MTPLFSGDVFCACGNSTCVADSTITDAVTMKIMSRTRKISVSGVMLISQNIPPPPEGALMAISLLSLNSRVDQACRTDMDRGVDSLHLLREIVVENDRDNRDRQAQRGRDERLRDTRRDHGKPAGTHHRHRLKRRENTDDGSEESDKRRRCPRGR